MYRLHRVLLRQIKVNDDLFTSADVILYFWLFRVLRDGYKYTRRKKIACKLI